MIISRTKFGKALRAVSQNRELARVTGINATRVAAATLFLAGLIAGYAGFVLAESVGSFTPYFGFSFFLITLTAAVAGGLGQGVRHHGRRSHRRHRPRGGGRFDPFVGGYISASYNLAFAFAILALVILVRPRGLFTNAGRTVFE